MTKAEYDMLVFARKYPGWHFYSEERPTTETVDSLEEKGLLVTNRNKQFSIPGWLLYKVHSDDCDVVMPESEDK